MRGYQGKGDVRISDTGQSWTNHTKEAYASRQLIKRANGILQGISSAISLKEVSGTNDLGGQLDEPLRRFEPQFQSKEWDDCGRMARDIMGPKGEDEPAKAVISPGGIAAQVPAVRFGEKSPEEQYALALAMDEAMNDPNLSAEEKRKAGSKVLRNYRGVFNTKGNNWVRAQSGKALSATDEKRLRIDEHAIPEIGEAYAILRVNRPDGDTGYPYHWAAVIMDPGGDRITLEATADHNSYEAEDPNWYFETYGTRDPAQTFHAVWQSKSSIWNDAHTLRMRTTDMLPEIEARIRPKTVRIDLKVNTAFDDSGTDDLYLILHTGGHFGTILDGGDTAEGETRTFTKPMEDLWIPGPTIDLTVVEATGLDEEVGKLRWAFPFHKQTLGLAAYGADYTLKLRLV
ncbi:MAG: hypothetical protein KDE27_08160 [Planctomycetes bacterium]|nr:hypothetical protein [Planctomycetota bacterium]